MRFIAYAICIALFIFAVFRLDGHKYIEQNKLVEQAQTYYEGVK